MRAAATRFRVASPTAIVLVLLVCVSLASAATTRHVGPARVYHTIQSAIVASASGDTILVDPGTYAENIDFLGKNLTLQSTDVTHPENYIIDGSGSVADSVTFQSGETSATVLSGFKIQNAVSSGKADIYIDNASPAITHCLLIQASTGIWVQGNPATPTISYCNFDGGNFGLISGDDTVPTIFNCLFSNFYQDGIYLWGSGNVTDCTLAGSVPGGSEQEGVGAGGAGHTVNLTRVQVTSCHRAGIYTQANGTFQNCLVTGCGTGIWVNSGDVQVVNCTCANNTYGLYGGEYLTVRNCLLANNKGYGMLGETPYTPSLAYCDVWGNPRGNYYRVPDPTGSNGNISVDPKLKPHYRLASQAGRWNDDTSSWVLDTATSPCIDAGDPASAYNQEPAPHGGRINLGWDGDTPQASKTLTLHLAFAGTTGYTMDGVEPDRGIPGSTFAFKVKYSSVKGNPATQVQLNLFNALGGAEIAGSPFTMTSDGSTTWTTGVSFGVSMQLDTATTYEYYFTASDGQTTLNLPASGRLTGPIADHSPTLDYTGESGYLADGVEPNRGISGTAFTFKVRYSQPDGNPAQRVRLSLFDAMTGVEIPGSPFTMTSDGATTWTTGVIFSVGVALNTATTYQYYFSSTDGSLSARLPLNGEGRILGPTVQNPPVLAFAGTNGYTADGVEPNRALAGSTFTFKVKYSSPDGKAATFVRLSLFNAMTGVEVAGSPFTMISDGTTNWSTGVTFSADVVLDTASTYQYYFSGGDGALATRLPQAGTGRFLGPNVISP